MKWGIYKMDHWFWSHLFGSYLFARLLIFCGIPHWKALLLAMLGGIFYEFLDATLGFKKKKFYLWQFDERGGDFRDILANAIGVSLAIWI